MKLPQIGETWTHYKGGKYTVVDVVWGAEGEDLVCRVVYRRDTSIYKAQNVMLFSRPLWNFLEEVPDFGYRFRAPDA